MFEEENISLSERVEKMFIKPCPFCGGKADVVFIDNEGYEVDELNADFIQVRCVDCDVWMEDVLIDEDVVDELVERWNKRVGEKDV